jgi:anti-sigma B factor antagonist
MTGDGRRRSALLELAPGSQRGQAPEHPSTVYRKDVRIPTIRSENLRSAGRRAPPGTRAIAPELRAAGIVLARRPPTYASTPTLSPSTRIGGGQSLALPSHFSIEADVTDARHLLRLRGELDMAAAVELEQAIGDACRAATAEVVIDLRGLDFIDSSGLAAIIRGRAMCAEHVIGYSLIRSDKHALTRLFEMAGMDADLPFRDPRPEEGLAPGAIDEPASGS